VPVSKAVLPRSGDTTLKPQADGTLNPHTPLGVRVVRVRDVPRWLRVSRSGLCPAGLHALLVLRLDGLTYRRR
jgi:hypothetical protein